MSSEYRPIYSAFEDDADLEDEISEFAINLAEYVDSLQDVFSEQELDRLALLARELGAKAERLGYPPLVDVSQQVELACGEGKPDVAEEALRELTGLARRIRQGHRGAA